MIPGRGTSTDQIVNVIQVIQMGKKSGLLTIERDEHGTLVQGELVFVHGQITQARCGTLTGQQALNWINTWTSCRFTFAHTEIEKGVRPPVSGTLPTPRFDSAGTRITSQEHSAFSNPFLSTGSVPRRIRRDDEALHLLSLHNSSRLHRHLFLLIDGRRTTTELIRLMGRRPEEVYRLLQDLERIQVIMH